MKKILIVEDHRDMFNLLSLEGGFSQLVGSNIFREQAPRSVMRVPTHGGCMSNHPFTGHNSFLDFGDSCSFRPLVQQLSEHNLQ